MILNHALLIGSIIAVMAVVISPVKASESELDKAIAQADEAQAKQVALQCTACHSVKEGVQEAKLGPSLWGVINRSIASDPNYDYSTSLSDKKGIWDSHSLDSFLRAPDNFATGTKMTLPGIDDLNTRAHIIRYLHSLSTEPTKFETKAENHASVDSQASIADPFGQTWPAGEGRDLTGYACSSCHSLAIVKQQGQTPEGWSELIDWMIEEQGMSELDADDRAVIVNYLSINFNAESPRN